MAFNELLRLYTPEGKPTDTFKQRGEVHRDGDWHATVHLWVINPVGELLFQKRADTTELNPGLCNICRLLQPYRNQPHLGGAADNRQHLVDPMSSGAGGGRCLYPLAPIAVRAWWSAA